MFNAYDAKNKGAEWPLFLMLSGYADISYRKNVDVVFVNPGCFDML